MSSEYRHHAAEPAWRPVLSVLVGVTWLLLQQAVDPGNVLTAVVLGWLVITDCP